MTNDRFKKALLLIMLPGSCLVAGTLSLTSALVLSSPAEATDFSHAKQIIVPATRYRRHFDSEMRETSSYSMNPSNGSAVDPGSGYPSSGLSAAPMPYTLSMPSYSTSSSSAKSKNGLVPPPPAMTPSIVAPSAGMVSPMSHPSLSNFGIDALSSPQAQAVSSQVAHATAQLDQLLKEGKFTEAQTLIKNYIRAFPKDRVLKSQFVQTLITNGKSWVASKDFDDAIKAAREALNIEPSSTTASAMLNDWLKKKGVDHASDAARLKMADSLAREGKNTEALVEYRAALKIKPSVDGHVGAGTMLFKEGKKETAKAEFQKALELDPNSGAALRQLGSLRYTQGDIVGANNDLTRALVINSDDKVAGRTLIDLWHRQVAKNPRDASQHLGLARAYQISGDLKSAQNEYKQVVRLEPDNPNLPAARQSFKLALARQEAMKAYQAAQTLDTNGAIREAHSKIVEAAGIAPTDIKIRLYEGDLSMRLGLYSQAHDAYMSVIREDSKNEVAAKKLQELAAKTQTTRMIMPPTAPQMGATGMASPSVMNFLNQQQGGQPPLLAQLGSQMRPGELPPAATIPSPTGAVAAAGAAAAASAATTLPTDTQVNSLAGFLGQLRGFQQSEKDRMQKFEDATHKALGYSKGGSGGSALDLPPLPPLPPLPSMPSALTTETPVTAGAAATTAPSAAAAPSLLQGNAQPSLLSQLAQTQAPMAVTAPDLSSSTTSSTMPQPAPALLNALRPEIPPAPQVSQDFANKVASLTPEQLKSLTSPANETQAAALKDLTPEQQLVAKQALSSAAGKNNGTVRFELEGVVPSKSQIKLKVVLKNDRDFPMELPSSIAAKIMMPGHADQTAKVEFTAKQISAHGAVHGVIKVPGRDLNASADVFLPNFLPPSEQYRDVHLTVPISKL